jgi:RimJ/RimL family protein N-acetyltransferase
MLIRSGEVELRSFEPSLSGALYEVRNHPSVREHLRSRAPIARADHERWVEENLVRSRRLHLFLVFVAAAPRGLALLRNFSGAGAEVGVMMVEARRHRLAAYKATHLIGYYAFEVLGLERLLSNVPRHNRHALAFNLACGLERTGNDSEAYLELVLTRERSRTHPVHRRFRARYPIIAG